MSSTTTQTAVVASSPSSVATPAKRRGRTFTRAELAQRIANGETLVLHRRKIYKLDKWINHHPGGELAILHFVGRDATDEIEAYHSDDTLQRLMSRFVIGYLDESDWKQYCPLVPPVQLGYRKGKLDHPLSHLDMWSHRQDALRADNRSEKHDDNVNPDALQTLFGNQHPKQADALAKLQQSQRTLIVDRPSTFPLPVELLEPPPTPQQIDSVRENDISQAFKELHQQVKDAGLYTLNPWRYTRESIRYALLAFMAWWFWSTGQVQVELEKSAATASSNFSVAWLPFSMASSTLSFLLSSVFLGLLWHQLTFTAHDAGHSGITHTHSTDRLIGIALANFIGGLSIGWWCDNHDVHHLVTNHPEHDPDIQHMPFFAISSKFVLAGETQVVVPGEPSKQTLGGNTVPQPRPAGLWSSYYRRVLVFDAPSRLFLRYQTKLYYIVMSLARFNLYANSYGFLALKAKRDKWMLLELIGLGVFWGWFGYGLLASLPSWPLRITYLLISHMVTSPVHVQIVLSHFAQSSQDLGLFECFASRQIRTTMDVDCPTWLDFVHGGLHMQVSHHLFPRIPRHNLRQLRDDFVKPFCQKWKLEYEEYGFVCGNGKVLDTLAKVAGQVELLAKVADAKAKGLLH